MPQFPMTESRRRVLTMIPDYAVTITPSHKNVIISHQGQQLAASDRALLVQETRHADVYYLPREDVDLSMFTPTAHSTYCPFKGHASYWSVTGVSSLQDVAWSYEDPYPEVATLKRYMSFYTDRVEQIVR